MRVLVHDYSGHPFQVELSRWLAAQGHEVLHVYAAFFQTPRGSLQRLADDLPNFQIEGLQLKSDFAKYSFFKRRFQEVEYGKVLVARTQQFNPDVLISSNNPLDAQNVLWKYCRKNNVPHVFWLQDVYSMGISSILQEKMGWLGGLIGWHYSRLERNLLRQSTAVVPISPDFLPILNQWQISKDNLHVIANWAPLAELPPASRINDWAEAQGLVDHFVFLYSGTLGLKHNPEYLLALAQHFQAQPKVQVVVISEGLGAQWLRQQKQSMKLDNLRILNYQQFSQMPQVLASADVLLAILEASAGVYSVPSKVLTYLCAGKPILLSVPPNNLAARIVVDSQAGLVTSGRDEFLQAAEQLCNNQLLGQQMGARALAYAQESFNIERIGKQFERVLQKCLRR